MGNAARKQTKRTTPLLIGAATAAALAVAVGFMVVRAHAPVPEASAPPLSSVGGASPVSLAGLPPAPDVEVVMYQGETAVGGAQVRLSKLWGTGKPVVLNFFAGLCPPCRAELPDFQRLYSEKGNGKFTLIALDVGPFVGLGSRDDGKALLRELKITFPAGTTMVAAPVRAYGIVGMPTTIFITLSGKIFKKYTGVLTRGQMETFVDELLKASGSS
jgi:thiol-disulfide isomerase/thioredoxin